MSPRLASSLLMNRATPRLLEWENKTRKHKSGVASRQVKQGDSNACPFVSTPLQLKTRAKLEHYCLPINLMFFKAIHARRRVTANGL